MDQMYMDNLEEFVFDENKIVSIISKHPKDVSFALLLLVKLFFILLEFAGTFFSPSVLVSFFYSTSVKSNF